MQLRAVLRATLLGAAGVAGVAGVAHADRAVQVELVGDAPFSADQLASALRVRVSGSGAGVIARVRASGGEVVVAIDHRERAVTVGARTGTDAARLVALAIADLVLDDLAVPPVDSPVALHADAGARPARRGLTAPEPIEIGVIGSASAWSAVMAGGSLEVALPRGRWVAAASLGGGELVDGDLHLSTATLRLGGGVRTGELELLAHVVVSPIWVSDGVGDSTVLAGAGASARLRLAVSPGVHAVLAVGVDAYATRTEYELHAATIQTAMPSTIATPWVAPWLGLGIEVSP